MAGFNNDFNRTGSRRDIANRNVPDKKKTVGNAASKSGLRKIQDARLKIIARQKRKMKDAREKIQALQRQSDARARLSNRRLGVVGTAVLGDIVPKRTIPNQRPVNQQAVNSYSSYRRPSPLMSRQLGVDFAEIYRDYSDHITLNDRPAWRDPKKLRRLTIEIKRPSLPQTLFRQGELNSHKDDTWLRPAAPSLRMSDDIKSRLEPAREEGFRIVVSNLQNTVTHEDIKELFEDIGPLLGSRLVRPGTAEVIYMDLKDAVTAVDTYHNRQLDGQPMKCLLVKPSSSISKGLVGTTGTVMPDLGTIHKALFTK